MTKGFLHRHKTLQTKLSWIAVVNRSILWSRSRCKSPTPQNLQVKLSHEVVTLSTFKSFVCQVKSWTQTQVTLRSNQLCLHCGFSVFRQLLSPSHQNSVFIYSSTAHVPANPAVHGSIRCKRTTDISHQQTSHQMWSERCNATADNDDDVCQLQINI